MLWSRELWVRIPSAQFTNVAAVAQWQSTVTTLIHNFVGHFLRIRPDCGAEYMANDRLGLAGSNPVPPARDVSGGFSATPRRGIFSLETYPLHHFWDFNLSISTRIIQSPP